VRRLLRIFLYGATALSFVLCAATGVFWVRSYRVIDVGFWVPAGGSNRGYEYQSALGVFSFNRMVVRSPALRAEVRSGHIPVTPAQRQGHQGWMDQQTWHGFAWHTSNFANPGAKLSGYSNDFSLPYWFIFLCAGILPAVLLYRKPWRIRHRPGRCAKCGYDLCATPERCPECGTVPRAVRLQGPPG
jgi:hypothetical protein